MRDIYIIKITWENDMGPYLGPVVGLTRVRRLCTLIRKRLKANKQQYLSVDYKMLSSAHWFFGLDCMLDPTDRLLASVFDGANDVIDGNLVPTYDGPAPP